jgi:hypothetical protein
VPKIVDHEQRRRELAEAVVTCARPVPAEKLTELRRVYELTDAGREALAAWIEAPVSGRDELDLWCVRGPINAYDSGRLAEMRCELGVGGRILEVYDPDSGEGLELARITLWEPGRRLAWKSSLDDVTIDVRFDPSATRSSGSKRPSQRAAKTVAARHSLR